MSKILKIIGLLVIMFSLAGCGAVVGAAAGGLTAKYAEPQKVAYCDECLADMANELAPKGDGYEGKYSFRCQWKVPPNKFFIENAQRWGHPVPEYVPEGVFYAYKLHVKQYGDSENLCLEYKGKGNNWKDIEGKICRNLGEAKPKRLDNEKQKLANIPKTATSAKVFLRKQPKTISSEEPVRAMLKKHDFFDIDWNPNGSFHNDFVDNGDGTLTDKATGLMWQKDGSPKPLTLKRATRYIIKLNHKRFLGYSDWRMPTIEELASTVTRSVSNGLHINPIFARKQKVCWSSDSGIVEDEYMKDVWIADFYKGRVVLYVIEDTQQLIGDYMETFYVKGVRSAR